MKPELQFQIIALVLSALAFFGLIIIYFNGPFASVPEPVEGELLKKKTADKRKKRSRLVVFILTVVFLAALLYLIISKL